MPRVRLVAGPLRSGTCHSNRFRIARGVSPSSRFVLEPLTLSVHFSADVISHPYPSTWKRDLPTRTKRKLHAIGGARGLWSLPVRTAIKVNGVPYDRPANPYHAENDSLILGTDAIPSPGFSRVRMSPLSFSTAIDLTWMRDSSGHAHPRATLRSQLASRRHCRRLIVLPRHRDPTCTIKCHPGTRAG
jgi:hypothetical protein